MHFDGTKAALFLTHCEAIFMYYQLHSSELVRCKGGGYLSCSCFTPKEDRSEIKSKLNNKGEAEASTNLFPQFPIQLSSVSQPEVIARDFSEGHLAVSSR